MRSAVKIIAGTVGIACAGAILVLGAEVIAAIRQPLIPFQNPSRGARRFGGGGQSLTYIVIGDSTGAGQGAQDGGDVATQTAEFLARDHRVTLYNLAVSGARMRDILDEQTPRAAALKPDIVLIAAGANDSTHFTPSAEVARDLAGIIAGLRAANPQVKIVATGCPYMGSIPRFAQPLRWFAGTQGRRINAAIVPVLNRYGVVNADIDHATGPAFSQDPSLFSGDRFHPDNRGYALWTTVLDHALDQALR